MEVEVVKFDNLGRGIGYINDKIIFIPKTVPGDIVLVKIVKDKKSFLEGKLIKMIKPSKKRIDVKCPYFDICGGCDLLNISVSERLDYKIQKINELLNQNKIDYSVKKIIKSKEQYNYRNKISLKVVDSKIGFYEEETHNLIEVDYCYLCKNTINDLIKDLHYFNIVNGNIIVRCNYNDELLINILSTDKVDNISKIVEMHKIVGIIQNDKVIYGENYFIDKVDKYLFKVSYNSFFQINPFITEELFKYIEEYTKDSKNILDFYCGVGTLGISASNKDKRILGVEIVENAIKDANMNKNFNGLSNIDFKCMDASEALLLIEHKFDTIILDPPRNGVNNNILDKIIKENISKVIYISCNPSTLIRDLKILLEHYNILDFFLLDMFPNTQHVESCCVLNLK